MRVPPAAYFALFTVSGFAGLIYQSLWSQYLRLLLGHAAYAQTLVLAIFMGGMALGAWLVGRFTHRIGNLLLGYAAAELGIGLIAFAFHPAFRALADWAFGTALPSLGATGGDLLRWGLASVLLLPASVLLGTTFPLMSGGILRMRPESGGRTLTMLYFTNSFGAALGVLASGFVLVDRFGLGGTMITAGALNVALAVAVFALARRAASSSTGSAGRGHSESRSAPARVLGITILAVAAATGVASFIHEIAWIRMLSMATGASTHAFEVMLAAFILSMALGALWLRTRIAAIRDDLAWLAGLLLAKAVLAVAALAFYGEALELVRWAMQAASRTDAGYAFVTAMGMVAALLVIFPAAFCAGMTLPLATHALTSRGFGEGSIGRVYGANTAGCIVGAVFATHVGMEALGVKGLTGFGALLDAAAAMALLILAGARVPTRLAVGGSMAALALGAGMFLWVQLDYLRMASGVFRYADFIRPGQGRVSFHRDGKTATVSVVEIDGIATIRTNGKPDSGLQLDTSRPPAEDEATLLLLAALPLAMRPDAANVANIGFGTGVTTHALLGSPNVQRVDSVEIERAIVEAARRFQPRNARAYGDPRSHLRIEDARAFFASSGTRYDVIVSEPSNPWVSGVSTLFSEEFYGELKRHLHPQGLLVQWIHAYELDLDLLSSVFKAIGRHFPDYAVYAWNPGDLYVVATPAQRLPALTDSLFAFPLAGDLARLGVRGVDDLNGLRIGGRRVLEPLFDQSALPANSDFHPVLDQRAPRARFRRDNVFQLRGIRDAMVSPLALLDEDHRVTRARIEQPGPMPPRVAKAAAALEAIDVFAGLEPRPRGQLTPALRMQAVTARVLLPDCRGAQEDLVRAAAELASATVPYLSAIDTAPLFERIRAAPCWEQLDDAARVRITLLRAMSRRDSRGIAEYSTALLRVSSSPSEPQTPEYVVAAISGMLAQDQARQAAAAARGTLVASLPERERQRLLFRLTMANAEARSPSR